MAGYRIPSYLANHHLKSPEEREIQLETAFKEHPEDGEVLLMMKAQNYSTWPEKHDEGIVICERIIKESAQPNLVGFACWCVADLYFDEKKNYSKAAGYLLKMIELEPEAIEAMLKLAEVYMAEKKWEDALLWAQKALTDEDYAAEAHETAGNIYVEKKEYDLAIATYNKALALKPESTRILCCLGRAYAYKEEYTTAMAYLHQAVALDSNNADALYCLGLCWQREDDFYRAMDFYTKALKVNPNIPEVYNNIGNLYYDHEGDYKGAIGFFEKAIAAAVDPLHSALAPVYLNLSKLYQQMLEEEMADHYQRKWLECVGLAPLL